VSPGTTLTPSLEDRIRGSADPDQAMKDFCDRQPIGRLGDPSEIVKAYLFAADDEAGFLDGVNIAIDGGMSI
nr:SDR family oxidoreductase [Oscillospiraceae bacterium]